MHCAFAVSCVVLQLDVKEVAKRFAPLLTGAICIEQVRSRNSDPQVRTLRDMSSDIVAKMHARKSERLHHSCGFRLGLFAFLNREVCGAITTYLTQLGQESSAVSVATHTAAYAFMTLRTLAVACAFMRGALATRAAV